MKALINKITFTARNRETIISLHSEIADNLETSDAVAVEIRLSKLRDYTKTLANGVIASKS